MTPARRNKYSQEEMSVQAPLARAFREGGTQQPSISPRFELTLFCPSTRMSLQAAGVSLKLVLGLGFSVANSNLPCRLFRILRRFQEFYAAANNTHGLRLSVSGSIRVQRTTDDVVFIQRRRRRPAICRRACSSPSL